MMGNLDEISNLHRSMPLGTFMRHFLDWINYRGDLTLIYGLDTG